MLEVALPEMHLVVVGKVVATREISEILTTVGVDLHTRPDQVTTPRLRLVPLVLITPNPISERALPMLQR
jgi:hypothetical protein